MKIRAAADIETLEACGLDAAYPKKSPWDILAEQAKLRPDAVAIRYLRDATDPARDERVTCADLAARILGAARLFRRHGVSSGHAVAILAQHTPSAQPALLGAQVAGRACPINPMLKPDHVAGLIRAAGVAAVVVTGATSETDGMAVVCKHVVGYPW